MDELDFQALVGRLERESARDAAGYRRRVAALAALGYGYVLVMLLLLIGATVAVILVLVSSQLIVGIKFLFPLLALIWITLRSLWVKMEPPDGIRVTRDAAPALYALVDDVAGALRAPPVHEVTVDGDLNAGIVQIPRLGPFGWYRNHLVIGLPILQATEPDEWRAILAHEMGHLSGNHGRFGAWVYRIRASWSRLYQALKQNRSRFGMLVFGRFLSWYAPYFNAYSFVLARQHEYAADRAAAELVGADVTCRALLRIDVAGNVLSERFWPGLIAAAAEQPTPPADAFERMRVALQTPPDRADATRWIAASWQRAAGVADTHPALADRLRALGWHPTDGADPEPPPPPPLAAPTAAERYLGDLEPRIRATIDQAWSRGTAPSWKARHERLGALLDRVAELDATPADKLSVDEEWERIDILTEIGHHDRAVALVRALHARAPDHLGARFFVGRVLLDEGNPAGVELIEGVMREAPGTTAQGCDVLIDYFESHGDQATAAKYRQQVVEYSGVLEKAHEERHRVPGSMRVDPHDLPDERVAEIRRALAPFRRVKRAYLARRRVKWLPERPCYVLCLIPRWFVTRHGTHTLVGEVAKALGGSDGLIVFITPYRRVRRRMRKQAGARIV